MLLKEEIQKLDERITDVYVFNSSENSNTMYMVELKFNYISEGDIKETINIGKKVFYNECHLDIKNKIECYMSEKHTGFNII